MKTYSRTGLVIALTALWPLFGCGNGTAGYEPIQEDPITHSAYLTSTLWNDGEAEVAFYRVHRTRNQYGEPADQSFLVGSYLVKHDYDPAAEAKAAPGADHTVSAFKYALFYEFESGSYEYKRSYVVNARQADLRPLKASFTSFDWCSNLYREQAFEPGGQVSYLMRSDDYGNSADRYRWEPQSYPAALIPMVVRGMDFSTVPRQNFGVVLESGEVVSAVAERQGIEIVETEAGTFEAERIVVNYDGAVTSPIGEEADSSETYWRGTDDARHLIALRGGTGRYTMELVEAVRSPYWDENVYEELQRVSSRP